LALASASSLARAASRAAKSLHGGSNGIHMSHRSGHTSQAGSACAQVMTGTCA
jgi:hypothetical protein